MKKLQIICAIFLFFAWSGCSQIPDHKDNSYQSEKYDIEFVLPPEYQRVEGTELEIGSFLEYQAQEKYVENIHFGVLENNENLDLDTFLISYLPNRNLAPADDNEYLEELQESGWEKIEKEKLEYWNQNLQKNLDGYESYAYITNPQETKYVIMAIWNLTSPREQEEDMNFVMKRYQQFRKIVSQVAFL